MCHAVMMCHTIQFLKHLRQTLFFGVNTAATLPPKPKHEVRAVTSGGIIITLIRTAVH